MTLTFKIKKPIDVVFNYLSDMQEFVSVHPVISKMEETKSGHFRVSETLMLGFIPVSFTYNAHVDPNYENKSIAINATVMGINKISMRFDLVQENEYCNITEFITFKSYLPVKFVMERIFRKQHTLLFKNIEKVNK